MATATANTDVLGALLTVSGLYLLFALDPTFQLVGFTDDEREGYVGGIFVWLSSLATLLAAHQAFAAFHGRANVVSPMVDA